MMTDALTLPEELMLIALRDDRGTIEAQAGMYTVALSGAILTELFLAGAIEPYEKDVEGGWFRIGAGTRLMLRATSQAADVDPLFRSSLESIRDASEDQQMQVWVQNLARHELPHKVARRLCQRGILREAEERVLIFFSKTVFPEIDPAPEAALKQRLEDAIFGDSDAVDERTALLIALAHPTHMLGVYFDRAALKERSERIEWLTHDNLIGDATHKAVMAIQAAQTAATVAATNAAMISSIN